MSCLQTAASVHGAAASLRVADARERRAFERAAHAAVGTRVQRKVSEECTRRTHGTPRPS